MFMAARSSQDFARATGFAGIVWTAASAREWTGNDRHSVRYRLPVWSSLDFLVISAGPPAGRYERQCGRSPLRLRCDLLWSRPASRLGPILSAFVEYRVPILFFRLSAMMSA